MEGLYFKNMKRTPGALKQNPIHYLGYTEMVDHETSSPITLLQAKNSHQRNILYYVAPEKRAIFSRKTGGPERHLFRVTTFLNL